MSNDYKFTQDLKGRIKKQRKVWRLNMALVKCPECGREKVSDSAVACPDCGFGIKEYYDKVKQELIKKKRAEEQKKQKEELQKQKEQQENEIISRMSVPRKPSIVSDKTFMGSFFTSLAVVGFIVMIATDGEIDFKAILAGIVCLIFGLTFLGTGWSDYKEEKRIYEVSLVDAEKAKRELLEFRRRQAQEEQAAKMKREEKKQQGLVICPMCGNKTGKRIGTVNRAVSVAAVGLASGKIGKQYKCSRCGHLW